MIQPSILHRRKTSNNQGHLERAIDNELHPNQLYISFASAAFRFGEPSLTPKVSED